MAQAQRIEAGDDRLTFTFSPAQQALKKVFEQHRGWLEEIARQVGGRRITVTAAAAAVPPPPAVPEGQAPEAKAALRDRAMADASVQAMLDVFPAQIRDVEEV